MHSSVLIGRHGIPAICRTLRPEELRCAIQPDNDREEFLLLLVEELAMRAIAAEQLGEDYDEDDDEDCFAEKLSLKEKAQRAELQVSQMLDRMENNRKQTHELLGVIKSAMLNQSLVASTEARLSGLLLDLNGVKELLGRKWDELVP